MKKIWVLLVLLIVGLYSVEALNIPAPPPAPGESGSSDTTTTQDTSNQQTTEDNTQDINDEQVNYPSNPSTIPSTNSAPTVTPTSAPSNVELTSCKAQLVQCQNELTKAQTVFPKQVTETKSGSIITFLIVVLIVALIISVWILHKKKEFTKRETREKVLDYVYLQMSKGYNRQAIYRALSGRDDIDKDMLVDIFKEVNSKVNKR